MAVSRTRARSSGTVLNNTEVWLVAQTECTSAGGVLWVLKHPPQLWRTLVICLLDSYIAQRQHPLATPVHKFYVQHRLENYLLAKNLWKESVANLWSHFYSANGCVEPASSCSIEGVWSKFGTPQHPLTRNPASWDYIIFIWTCRTMLEQKIDGAGFLIDTSELKISMKTCFCDNHLPYAHVYIVVQWWGPPCLEECQRSQVQIPGRILFLVTLRTGLITST